MNQIEEFKLDKLISNCDYITKYCNHLKSNFNDELNKKCNRLVEYCKFYDEISDQYRFGNIPLNGFYQFNKISLSFTDCILNQIKTKNKVDPNIIKLFNFMFTYGDWLKSLYKPVKESIENRSSTIKEKLNALSTKEFYCAIHSNSKDLHLLFSDYLGFYLPKEIQRGLKYLNFYFALTSHLPSSINTLWSKKKKGKNSARVYQNCNLKNPFDFWHQSEGFFTTKFINYLKNKNIPVTSRTIYIPKQKRFRITYKGKILDFDKLTKEEKDDYFNDKEEQERQNSPGLRHRNKETIRCRYSFINSNTKIKESLDRIGNDSGEFNIPNCYSETKKSIDNFKEINLNNNLINHNLNKNIDSNQLDNQPNDKNIDINIGSKKNSDELIDYNPEKILIVYYHGGGFLVGGSKGCEIYLREMVNELNGIPTLSIDYSLTVPFPIANQEILDVYLWLFSGKQDVEDKIGFHPKKIVLAGDSAGGLLALQQTITINELNKLSDHKIPLPISIVAVYASISLGYLTPSEALFTLENLVQFDLFLMMLSMYGANVSKISDFKKIEKTELFQQIALKNKKLFDENIIDDDFDFDPPKKSNDKSPWFKVDYKTYKNYADYIATFYQNFIISPILYDKFDELKNVKLFAIVGENDFLLDNSLEICNLWLGDVTLDIKCNLIHGFLQMKFLSEENKEAIDLVIRRLQEACNLK